jgi:hypothetical protein
MQNSGIFPMLVNNRTDTHYEQALLDIILGGDHYRNGMVQNSDTLMNNTVDAFLSDLKRAKVYDVFNGADIELQVLSQS